MSAGQTFQPDIRSDANHLPFMAAAWMRFAKYDPIIDLNIFHQNNYKAI